MASKDDKKPLATGRQVYNRVKWDPNIDESRFAVIWRQRDGALDEVPFLEWREDVIPWHRVEAFSRDGLRVWDRERRVDKIVASQEGDASTASDDARERADGALGAPGVMDLPTYRFDGARWEKVESARLADGAGAAPETLRVATYNVLFDSFARNHLDEARRHAAIFAELEELGADVIALEEVEPSFVRAILKQPWVRRAYHASDAPAAPTCVPHGQLVLSRWPMRCALLKFSPQKRAVFAQVDFDERPIQFCALHLTSSRAKNPEAKREAQIEQILSLTRSAADAILLGDFNLSRGEQVGTFEIAGFLDAWPHVHPDSRGLTFDSTRNKMAEITAGEGRRARFDRILCRLSQGSPVEIERFADERLVDGSPPSDHWGLVATIRLGKERALHTPPIVRSAAVILPPRRCWPQIQAIRSEHDRRRLDRWMPHITLLYPFTPERHFDEAATLLSASVRDVEPFEISLEELGTFSHTSSTTLWASCESAPEGALEAMQARVERAPWTQQSERGDQGYTPHLTLGSLEGSETSQIVREREDAWTTERFTCTEIALISRRDDGPFEIRRLIPLARGRVAKHVLRDELGPDTHTERALGALDVVEDLMSASGQELRLIGSMHMDGALPGSDVDLLIRGDREPLEILSSSRDALATHPKIEHMILVEESKQPVLRASFEGVWLDVQAARRGSDDPVSLRAEECATIADAICDRMASIDALQVFGEATRFLKLWAKRRGVSGAAWGYWPGVAWAAVASWACSRVSMASEVTLERVLLTTFDALANFGWQHTFGIGGEDAIFDGPGDWMPLVGAGLPGLNLTRGMTTSTAETMRVEFARAARIATRAWLRKTSWRELLDASVIDEDTPHIWLAVTATDEALAQEGFGLLRSRALKLILELEQTTNLSPRPWPSPHISTNSMRWRIDLRGAGPRHLEQATHDVEAFLDALATRAGEGISFAGGASDAQGRSGA